MAPADSHTLFFVWLPDNCLFPRFSLSCELALKQSHGKVGLVLFSVVVSVSVSALSCNYLHPLRSFLFFQTQCVKILHSFLCYSLCPCCSALVSSLCLCLCLCLRLCLCLCLPVFASLSLPVVWSGLVWLLISCFCTWGYFCFYCVYFITVS